MVRMEWVFIRFSLYLRMNRFDDISRSAPFGMPYTDENGADRYKLDGKEYDAVGSLNLYDFEARMYDPALARFMSPDPLAARYPSVSPYAYCANNTIRKIDPTGQIVLEITQEGRIKEQIEDKTKDMIRLVDKDGNVRLDANKNPMEIQFPVGTIISAQTKDYNVK